MSHLGMLLPPSLPPGWVRFEATETRTSVHPEEYTGDSRVELDNLESRGGPSSVLNPLVAGRFASSRLRR